MMRAVESVSGGRSGNRSAHAAPILVLRPIKERQREPGRRTDGAASTLAIFVENSHHCGVANRASPTHLTRQTSQRRGQSSPWRLGSPPRAAGYSSSHSRWRARSVSLDDDREKASPAAERALPDRWQPRSGSRPDEDAAGMISVRRRLWESHPRAHRGQGPLRAPAPPLASWRATRTARRRPLHAGRMMEAQHATRRSRHATGRSSLKLRRMA